MYGASAALGFGSSTLLVTVLTMLADLIAENVVRNLHAWNYHKDWLFLVTFCFDRNNLLFRSLLSFVMLLVFASLLDRGRLLANYKL